MRNKAKQIQDGDDVVDFAVDRDETYNADEGMYCKQLVQHDKMLRGGGGGWVTCDGVASHLENKQFFLSLCAMEIGVKPWLVGPVSLKRLHLFKKIIC